jgi:hypothetical protein
MKIIGHLFIDLNNNEPLTKVFAKGGLDILTSSSREHQQQSGPGVQFSALVHTFNNIFFNGHLYRAGGQ